MVRKIKEQTRRGNIRNLTEIETGIGTKTGTKTGTGTGTMTEIGIGTRGGKLIGRGKMDTKRRRGCDAPMKRPVSMESMGVTRPEDMVSGEGTKSARSLYS